MRVGKFWLIDGKTGFPKRNIPVDILFMPLKMKYECKLKTLYIYTWYNCE